MSRSILLRLMIRCFWLLLIVGLCFLPGPRSLIVRGADYVLSPSGVASTQAGLHVSAYPYCWLLGESQQELPYPPEIDPLVAGVALLVSIGLQIFIAINMYMAYVRLFWHFYDDASSYESETPIDAAPTPLNDEWQEDQYEQQPTPLQSRSA